MRAVATLLVALLWASSVFAQATLQQGGSTTQGHAPAYWSSGSQQPIVVDSGPAGGNTTGQGLSELNITARGTGTAPYAAQGTGQSGTIFQIQDAVSTNASGYHYLGFSANAGGGGLVTYGAAGGASALPLTFRVNGTSYQFPFTDGSVIGPGSSTVGHVACWNNTIGTLMSDCGTLLTIGGTNRQIQVNNSGVLGGVTMSGDATFNGETGNIDINQIGGHSVNLGGFFTTDASLRFTGAFTTELIVTGGTSVTLPTSGTLATRAGSEALTNKTVNGLTIDSTTGTLAITNGKTLTASNTLGFTGTDGSTLNVGTGGTLGTAAYTAASAYIPSNTQLTDSLGANVSLSNTGSYFDGPSVAQGTTGTWFASGTVTVNDTGSAAAIYCKLWDGTNVIASAYAKTIDATAPESISLSGYRASPAGNIRISCRDTTSTSGVILYNTTGNSKDSTLSAFRVN